MGQARTLLVLFWIAVSLCFCVRDVLSVAVTEVRLASADPQSDPYVLQGDPATLNCLYLVEPSEIVTEVEWEKDGVLVYLWTVDGQPEARDVLEGKVELDANSPSNVVIREAHMSMQGTYTCRVRTNGKMAQNDMFLMVIVDACDASAWKTHTDMVECTESINMHCVGIFPKPSPTCGVVSEKTGRFLNTVPFDSITKLLNGTYEVSLNRRFEASEWRHLRTPLALHCHIVHMGTHWRSGIRHRMFGEPGCEKKPPSLTDGYYNMTVEHSCWGFYGEGSTVEYHCEEPFALKGEPMYHCREGKWIPQGSDVIRDVTYPTCGDPNGAALSVSSLTCVTVLCVLHLILAAVF